MSYRKRSDCDDYVSEIRSRRSTHAVIVMQLKDEHLA